jgi:hypothetical protein
MSSIESKSLSLPSSLEVSFNSGTLLETVCDDEEELDEEEEYGVKSRLEAIARTLSRVEIEIEFVRRGEERGGEEGGKEWGGEVERNEGNCISEKSKCSWYFE